MKLSPIEFSPIWHPFTPIPPLGPRTLIVRGEGAYLVDRDGNRYLDATSSWWCNLHGHCHPRLVRALREQAGKLDQMLLSPHSNEVAESLADELLAAMGDPYSKVFYSDDGSTAVETALKMSLQYWANRGNPGRRKFLSLGMAYHGDTLGAVSVGGVDAYHQVFADPVSRSVQVPAPYCYRCPLGKSYPDCKIACIDPAIAALDTHGEELAAMIVEPLVMGAGGMISYPKEYLEKLVEECRKRQVLVIFDEVFTGFGRTGSLFAYQQLSSERPDIVCLSKGLTAGMLPLAATVTHREIFREFVGGADRAFYHGHTFTGNALGCSVARESLKLIHEERVLEKNQSLIRVLEKEATRFRELEIVGDVRHRGMIWAVELVTDRPSKRAPEPANGIGWGVAERLWKKGIWLRPLHNVMYVVPPYCVTEGELQGLFSMLYSELQYESARLVK